MATRKKKRRKLPPVARAPKLLKLDLGSGQHPAEGFKGVDIAPGVADFTFDLTSGEPWPWADSSVDEARASHFIEHIRKDLVDPRKEWPGGRLKFWWFFDEAWRVLKPGATLTLIWPDVWNDRAFQDPEHVDFIPAARLLYLNAEWRKANALDHYPIRSHWACVSHSPTVLTQPRFEGDIPINQRPDVVQRRMFVECVNVKQDNHAILKAVK